VIDICLMPGDGIGPEMIGHAERVLRALPLEITCAYADIGFGAYETLGTPLPPATLEKIRTSSASLFCAVTTPPNIPDYFSPVVRMRQELQLFSNLRPIKSIPHPSSRQNIDILIFRENTEGLYAGAERVEDGGNRAVTERVITRLGAERILRRAFETARDQGRSTVHVIHKANVLRETDGLFRAVALEIASEFPAVEMREMLVDTCAMELIRAPEQFEVIVTTNLFGDILSDEASMLVGGLGVAASGNIGLECAVFEPVHGSAPSLVGTGKANPIATLNAVVMMLEYLKEDKNAQILRQAIFEIIKEKKATPDLDGDLSTQEVVDDILSKV